MLVNACYYMLVNAGKIILNFTSVKFQSIQLFFLICTEEKCVKTMTSMLDRIQRNYDRHSATTKSFLLRGFLAGNYPNLQLKDIVGHSIAFAVHPMGSIFIQSELDDSTSDSKNKTYLYTELKPYLVYLMKNTFGSHLVLKFFYNGNAQLQREIRTLISWNIMELSDHSSARFVVQNIIQNSNVNFQMFLLKRADFVKLCQNKESKHLIQNIFHSVVLREVQVQMIHIKNEFPFFPTSLNIYRDIQKKSV